MIEVRDGHTSRLLGTLRPPGVLPPGQYVILTAAPPLSLRAYRFYFQGVDMAADTRIKKFQVVLQRDVISFKGGANKIEILVLVSGKPSWLKRVKGFRGA